MTVFPICLGDRMGFFMFMILFFMFEIMIYKLRLQDLKEALIEWKSKPDPSLFEGALLVTKFQFPELAIDSLRHQMEKIRRNIWLELNNYLTPLEQANVRYERRSMATSSAWHGPEIMPIWS